MKIFDFFNMNSIPDHSGLYAKKFTAEQASLKDCPQLNKLNEDVQELKKEIQEVKQMLREIYWAPGMPGAHIAQESY